MSPLPLREVAESEATGTVAAAYLQIRETLRVPLVNLVYRHLAAEEGRLEATWSRVQPSLADAATHELADELRATAERLGPVPDPLDASDLSDADLAAARATLAVYDRANALNLLAASALLDGSPGSGTPRGAPTDEEPIGPLLPLMDPAALDWPTRELLGRMSVAAAPTGADVLVPSLYRHLASSPALLRAVWAAAGRALVAPEAVRAAVVVRAEAARSAGMLPYPVERLADASARAILGRFASAMAAMLVAGRTIAAALR